MKIVVFLGDELDVTGVNEKVDWIRRTLNKDQYKVYTGGFLITEYLVEFQNDQCELLFRIRFPE